jgi:hypothetical protein
MFFCCESCVLSGRGLCDGLITRPEESYRMWRFVVRDQETSKTRRLKPVTGLWKIQPQWAVTPGKQTKQTTNKIQISYYRKVSMDLPGTYRGTRKIRGAQFDNHCSRAFRGCCGEPGHGQHLHNVIVFSVCKTEP